MTQTPPDLPDRSPPTPLDPDTATLIDSHLKAIDTVHIRVLGDDRSASDAVEAHLLARGLGVNVSLSEHMIPPPRNRYVFRYQGRTAFLTIAPDIP
ncbi:hypothetical protein [Falsirhodobacter sp. 20TX0035]|uniref:hypothetical protein n=1 Tax=Falsirhodobacter sp. 20TX0035 TaxID=3022019 RepID=UPI00232A8543|nr:hypothetical protein [Falsirhodobacter sp. 20TX0035]MDB6452146.1 hypothetical protein [Falsirhodobacter sp. 20TX0035]